MPAGIPGRLYWLVARPLHAAAASRGLAREVVGTDR